MKILFCIALVLVLFFSGCTNNTKIQKFNLPASNFSQLVALNIPIECRLITSEGIIFIKIKNQSIRAESGEYVLIKQGDNLYLRVPKNKISPQDSCEWIKVNETHTIYSSFKEFNPLKQDLDSYPSKNFLCDTAYIENSEFVPEGKVCLFWDFI